MKQEIVDTTGNIQIRRLTLEPGDAMPWHVDPYRRISTVVRGERLRIEFQDAPPDALDVEVFAGMAGWDEPDDRVHRAVNGGAGTYEEVTVFFLDNPGDVAQPEI